MNDEELDDIISWGDACRDGGVRVRKLARALREEQAVSGRYRDALTEVLDTTVNFWIEYEALDEFEQYRSMVAGFGSAVQQEERDE